MAIGAPAVWNARVPFTTPAETASAMAIPTLSTIFGMVPSCRGHGPDILAVRLLRRRRRRRIGRRISQATVAANLIGGPSAA